MHTLLLLPPIAFGFLAIVTAVGVKLLSGSAPRRKNKTDYSRESYACGEEVKTHRIQPDYSQFFPFAFFFTIAHVITLLVALMPAGAASVSGIGIVMVGGVVVGLRILVRKGQS